MPGLDVHIGLPLSENYRMAKSEHTILRSLEDWTALFFDRGWMVPYLYLTNQPPYRIFANIKDAVSTICPVSFSTKHPALSLISNVFFFLKQVK